jgi:putative sigma-54 modulation protein
MNLTVTGRHFELSPEVRRQIEKKIARLDRLLNANAVSAQCVLAHERQRVVCELTVRARGDHALVGIGRHARAATAVGVAVEKVAQQAQRLADRWKTRRRKGGPTREAAIPVEAVAEEPRTRVIRSRNYAVKPMTIDDAVLELTAGDQAFVVFRHAISESVVVVYRRPDGHVGLIDTEA